ncbi:unnamed protein product, partial [Iphiclides podalirius]
MKGIKILRATRKFCGDSAIGYIKIKRYGESCTVKTRVTPEHEVLSGYRVTMVINESKAWFSPANAKIVQPLKVGVNMLPYCYG